MRSTKPGQFYRTAIILMHAVVGWAYCGMLIGVGRGWRRAKLCGLEEFLIP
jgi:hypothetical protein